MKIYGKNPVLERLKANPKSIRVIFVETGHSEHSYIARKAKQHGIPVSVVEPRKMMKLGRSLNTQGLMMEVHDFAYTPYEDLLDEALDTGLTLLFCDGLTDPQNMGAIIRSLGCLSRFAIVLPTHDSVHVTDSVLRVACGGENYVAVSKVNNLSHAITKAKEKGFWIAGSVVKDGQDAREVKLPFPLGLVVGSEDRGIREVIQQKLDLKLTIPMTHSRMSLNAAHAVSMFCFEISKQRPVYVRKQKKEAVDVEDSFENLPE